MQRTQVYLPGPHLKALRREAKEAGLSVTELVRRIVAEHVEERHGIHRFKKEEVMAFVDLGRGTGGAASERHDEALDEALRAVAVR